MKNFVRTALLAVALIAFPAISDAASPQDEALTKAVQDKLMEGKQQFDATSVIVTSEDGVVHLRGDVQKRVEVERMKAAAASVPGVKRVETQIDVYDFNKGK